MNSEIPEDTLNTTIIGLEYQKATLPRIQFNTWVWFSLIGGVIIAFTAISNAIPSIFGENAFTAVVVLAWLVIAGIQMHIEYSRKRNALYYRTQRLKLRISEEFDSDNPDLDSITTEEIKL